MLNMSTKLTETQKKNRQNFRKEINDGIKNKTFVPFLDLKKLIIAKKFKISPDDVQYIESVIGKKLPDLGFNK